MSEQPTPTPPSPPKTGSEGLAASAEAAAGAGSGPPQEQAQNRARPGNRAAQLAPGSGSKASQRPQPVEDALDTEVAARFSILGIGQGGSRLASAFYSLGYRRVALLNTTDQDWGEESGISSEPARLSLDVGGAAKDTEIARQALHTRTMEVQDLLTRSWGPGTDYALLAIGLGGGSGSGMGPELVSAITDHLRRQGDDAPRVGAVVSLPTPTEGYQVCRNAVLSLQQLVNQGVSPLIMLDNGKIQQLYEPPMLRLHETANSISAQLLHLFNELGAMKSQLITFDASELAQLLDNGLITMGAADVGVPSSPADVREAIRTQLAGNVLVDADLRTGSLAACLFVGDEGTLNQLNNDFFDAGFEAMEQLLTGGDGERPLIHRGLYVGDTKGLQVYTMVSGLQPPTDRLRELSRTGGLLDRGGDASGAAAFLGVHD